MKTFIVWVGDYIEWLIGKGVMAILERRQAERCPQCGALLSAD